MVRSLYPEFLLQKRKFSVDTMLNRDIAKANDNEELNKAVEGKEISSFIFKVDLSLKPKPHI